MAEDFSGQNLWGRSFKGHNLTGANFSGADIRGANFKGACLAGAVFANVKAGLKARFQFVMSFFSYASSVLAGIFSYLFSFLILYLLDEITREMFRLDPSYKSREIILGCIVFCTIFLICMILVIRKKMFYKVFFLFLIAFVVFLVIYMAGTVAWFLASAIAEAWSSHVAAIVTGALAGAGFRALVVAGAGIGIVAMVIAGVWAGALFLVLAIAWTRAKTKDVVGAVTVAIFMSVGMSVLTVLILSAVKSGSGCESWSSSWAAAIAEAWPLVVAVSWAVTMILLIIYITWRTYKEDDQFAWLRRECIFYASLGGTNFQGADLQGAEFTDAILKGCRFDASSNITRTCFSQAKGLNLAHVAGTILENPAVRDLLITGNGEDKSYAGFNLKGACLKGANLSNTDLTEADLSGGTLEDASLINANLSKVQALDAEFRGADFTGACLHSWNIDSSTHLEGAHAAYVYLLDNYKERRPNSGEFREGEFGKLFQEVIHTVDFIFKNGIDWQAFILSFDKLRKKIRVENEAGEIAVQSIENKGDGVFVVRVAVSPDMDKGMVHSEFSREYDQQLKRIEERYMALLEYKEQELKSREREFSRFRESKEREIAIFREQNINLNEIIRDQAKRPVYIQQQQITEGMTMQDNRRKVHITGDVSGSNINLGEISGDVSAKVRHLPSSPDPISRA